MNQELHELLQRSAEPIEREIRRIPSIALAELRALHQSVGITDFPVTLKAAVAMFDSVQHRHVHHALEPLPILWSGNPVGRAVPFKVCFHGVGAHTNGLLCTGAVAIVVLWGRDWSGKRAAAAARNAGCAKDRTTLDIKFCLDHGLCIMAAQLNVEATQATGYIDPTQPRRRALLRLGSSARARRRKDGMCP